MLLFKAQRIASVAFPSVRKPEFYRAAISQSEISYYSPQESLRALKEISKYNLNALMLLLCASAPPCFTACRTVLFPQLMSGDSTRPSIYGKSVGLQYFLGLSMSISRAAWESNTIFAWILEEFVQNSRLQALI